MSSTPTLISSGPRTALSGEREIVWKSQLNNSATLNSHTNTSRSFQMHPDGLSTKRWALQCSETTWPVFLDVSEFVEQNRRISWTIYSCLQNSTNSKHLNEQRSGQLGLLAISARRFQWISKLKPYSPELIIIIFIRNCTIEYTIVPQHPLI
jgi:hypothetical protein